MSKKEPWICGDCNAEHPWSTKLCDAPQHDATVRAWRAENRVKELEGLVADLKRAQHSWQVSLDEFFDEYCEALYASLTNNESYKYKEEKHHPLDLSYAIGMFNETWVVIQEVKEGRRLDRKKNFDAR